MALTYGSSQYFTSDAATPIQTFMVDSTHLIVFYKDSSNYGKAIIGTISGQTVSYGTAATFVSAAIGECRVEKIDDSKYLIAWTYASGNNYQYLCIVTVSGTTVSFGSTASYYAYYNTAHTSTSYLRVSSSTAFTVGTYAYGYRWTSGTISGTTISISNESGTTIDPKQKIKCGSYTFDLWNEYLGTPYNEWRGFINSTSYPLVTAGTLSSNTVFGACTVGDYDYAVLDSTHFILVYKKSTSATNIYCRVITCSPFSIGTEYTVSTSGSSTNYLNVVALSSTSVMFNYVNSSGWVRYRPATISGSTVSFGTDTALGAAGSNNAVADTISSTCLVTAFRGDNNNYNKGAVRVATSSATHELTCSISQSSSASDTLSKELSLSSTISQGSEGSYALTGRTTHLLEIEISQGSEVADSLTQNFTHNLEAGISQGSAMSQSLDQAIGLKTVISAKATVMPSLQFYSNNIDFKTNYGFTTGAAYSIKTQPIDSTHFFVSWIESDYCYFTIGYVSENTITYDTPKKLSDATVASYDCIISDSSKILFVYSRGANQPCYSRMVVIYGGYSTTLYSECLVSSNYYCRRISVDYLGSNYYVAAFCDGFNSGYGTAVRLYNNSNTIEAGSKYVFAEEYIRDEIKVRALSSTTAIIGYTVTSTSSSEDWNQRYIIATIGGSISFGSECNPDGVSDLALQRGICLIDSTHAICSYYKTTDGIAWDNYLAIASISGSSVSFSEETSIGSSVYDIAKINSNRYAMLYADADLKKKGRVIQVSEDGFTLDEPFIFCNRSEGNASVCLIDTNKIIVSYNDATNNEYQGYSRVGLITQAVLKILSTAISSSTIVNAASRYIPRLTVSFEQPSVVAAGYDLTKQLQSSISQSSIVAESLYHELGLTAQIEQNSYMTPLVQRERLLSLALQGITAQSSSLDDIKALASVIEQFTSVSANAQAEKQLQTAISQVAELSALGTRTYNLQINIQSVSSASLHLIRLIELVDAMNAASTVQSGLSLEQILSAVFAQGSSLYAQAYRQLSLGLSVEQLASFPLTLDHIAQLVTLIAQEATTDTELELTHLLAQYVEAKATVSADFFYVFSAAVNLFAQSSMTVEGTIFHGVELVCAIYPEARAYFTAERTATLTAQIDALSSMEEILQELLKAYLEFKGSLDSIDLSGILGDKIILTGRLGERVIYYSGETL